MSLLTFLKDNVIFYLHTIVPKRGVLPMASKKGIITLTLVISREFVRPTVTRGLYVMNFNFFRIQNKIQKQVQDYITWKEKRGIIVGDYPSKFIVHIKKGNIEEVLWVDLIHYYKHLKATENAKFFISMAVKDLRVMFRWFKARKYNVIEPDLITEEHLTLTITSDTMEPMTIKKIKMGRPPKVDSIEMVQTLRKQINPVTKKERFSYRDISKRLKVDVSQVYKWANYDLSKLSTFEDRHNDVE